MGKSQKIFSIFYPIFKVLFYLQLDTFPCTFTLEKKVFL